MGEAGLEGRERSGRKDLSGAKVAVVGLGASGRAAARLALNEGGEVYGSDLRAEPEAPTGGADLRELGAELEWEHHDLERIVGADLVVLSPGIPPHAPVRRALAERGRPWISEPELAVRFYRGPLIAITGTNGKTSTAVIIDHLLDAAGIRSALGGNVGGGMAPPASDLALLDEAPDWYVLELSSFQLGGVETLKPDIGVVTNLSPDHLDHYDRVEDYYADKARLFERAGPDSRWVLPENDARVEGLAPDAPGRRYRFARQDSGSTDAFLDDGMLTLRVDGSEEPLLAASDLPLLGRHNHLNALTAALTAHLAGASTDGIRSGLGTVRALPHRLEAVAERDGVLWVNDSKATNVAATVGALDSLSRPVVLLLGGKDKGESYAPLREAAAKVRGAVVYGAAGERIHRELEGAVPMERVQGTFDAAVAHARTLAHPGDIVLLSPACSSFDMFDDYEARGRRFASLARGEG